MLDVSAYRKVARETSDFFSIKKRPLPIQGRERLRALAVPPCLPQMWGRSVNGVANAKLHHCAGITGGDARLGLVGSIAVQPAAPEGFSAGLSRPARTVPDSLWLGCRLLVSIKAIAEIIAQAGGLSRKVSPTWLDPLIQMVSGSSTREEFPSRWACSRYGITSSPDEDYTYQGARLFIHAGYDDALHKYALRHKEDDHRQHRRDEGRGLNQVGEL